MPFYVCPKCLSRLYIRWYKDKPETLRTKCPDCGQSLSIRLEKENRATISQTKLESILKRLNRPSKSIEQSLWDIMLDPSIRRLDKMLDLDMLQEKHDDDY